MKPKKIKKAIPAAIKKVKPRIELGKIFNSSRIWEVMKKPPGVYDGGYAIEFSVFVGQQFFDGFAIPAYIGAKVRVALIVPEVEQKMSKKLIERYFSRLRKQIEEMVAAKFSSEISMIILPGK